MCETLQKRGLVIKTCVSKECGGGRVHGRGLAAHTRTGAGRINALRVADSHDPPSVTDVLVAQAKEVRTPPSLRATKWPENPTFSRPGAGGCPPNPAPPGPRTPSPYQGRTDPRGPPPKKVEFLSPDFFAHSSPILSGKVGKIVWSPRPLHRRSTHVRPTHPPPVPQANPGLVCGVCATPSGMTVPTPLPRATGVRQGAVRGGGALPAAGQQA